MPDALHGLSDSERRKLFERMIREQDSEKRRVLRELYIEALKRKASRSKETR